MMDIALKMLFGERAKYAMLVSGICFATILMTQGLALFFGILSFSYATATNIRAPIWVVDPLVQQVGDNQPLRDTDVNRVRSVEGVAWAAPLYVGNAQAKLLTGGATQPLTLVGLDSDTFAGAPTRMVEGNILDLRLAQSVVVDAKFVEMMQAIRGVTLGVGDVFEMNDRRAIIVGVAKVAQGQGGATYVFTTWDRAKEYAPSQRKMLTHVLASPVPGKPEAEVIRAIEEQTGLQAVTESEFKRMSAMWMIALDSVTGHQVMDLLRDTTRGNKRTVIVVTHDPRTYQYADRVAEMEDGRILRVATPSTLEKPSTN